MQQKLNKACTELSELYGLSGTEWHIVFLISNGHSPHEIAEIRERSIETVRTQIKHIMQKVGVKRVSNLVVEVFRLAEKY